MDAVWHEGGPYLLNQCRLHKKKEHTVLSEGVFTKRRWRKFGPNSWLYQTCGECLEPGGNCAGSVPTEILDLAA